MMTNVFNKKKIIIVIVLVICLCGIGFYAFKLFKKTQSPAQPAITEIPSAPLSDNYEQIHYDQSQIYSPIDIGGKLAYIVFKGDETKIIYDGREDMKFNKDAGSLTSLFNLNDKLAYIITKNTKQYLGLEGKLISVGYDGIYKVFQDASGDVYMKVSFRTKVGNEYINKNLIVVNGKILDNTVTNCDLEVIGNQPVILFKHGKDLFEILYQGQKKEFKKAFYLGNADLFGGQLIYILGQDNKKFIVNGEEKIIDEDGDIVEIKIINDQLAYLVKGENRNYIKFGNEILGKNYKNVGYLSISDKNRLGYVVSNTEGQQGVILGGEEISKFYDEISILEFTKPIYVGDKLAFVATSGSKEMVVYGQDELGSYDQVNYLTSVNNKLVYIFQNQGNSYLVKEK